MYWYAELLSSRLSKHDLLGHQSISIGIDLLENQNQVKDLRFVFSDCQLNIHNAMVVSFFSEIIKFIHDDLT
jgi:hypothetical protein